MPAKKKQPTKTKLEKLRQFYQKTKDKFHDTHGDASQWLTKKSLDVEDFRTKSQQLLAATSLAGTMIMSKPVDMAVQDQLYAHQKDEKDDMLAVVTQEERQALLEKLQSIVKMPPGNLDSDEEKYLEQQLSDMLGFSVVAELEGHRLNHSIGIMGGEQHLRRYPTDGLENHDAYLEAGIAPARGAFGWFTENGELTETAIMREKYYFAVQTLYLEDWNTNYQELKPWYKFRKMIAINPADGLAVVGVVGDAGPAQWVQKQFGGSPEVIRETKIWSPAAQGRVILLFVDDPTDEVPLGVIDLNQLNQHLASADQGEQI